LTQPESPFALDESAYSGVITTLRIHVYQRRHVRVLDVARVADLGAGGAEHVPAHGDACVRRRGRLVVAVEGEVEVGVARGHAQHAAVGGEVGPLHLHAGVGDGHRRVLPPVLEDVIAAVLGLRAARFQEGPPHDDRVYVARTAEAIQAGRVVHHFLGVLGPIVPADEPPAVVVRKIFGVGAVALGDPLAQANGAVGGEQRLRIADEGLNQTVPSVVAVGVCPWRRVGVQVVPSSRGVPLDPLVVIIEMRGQVRRSVVLGKVRALAAQTVLAANTVNHQSDLYI